MSRTSTGGVEIVQNSLKGTPDLSGGWLLSSTATYCQCLMRRSFSQEFNVDFAPYYIFVALIYLPCMKYLVLLLLNSLRAGLFYMKLMKVLVTE